MIPLSELGQRKHDSDYEEDSEEEDIPLSELGQQKHINRFAVKSDDFSKDTPLSQLGLPKTTTKGGSSKTIIKMASSSRANVEANTESVTIVEVTTSFDPINPTFVGFEPQKTCGRVPVTVTYVNGHGWHDVRIPITDIGMTSFLL
jgi:hypothetical protein